MLQKVHQHAAKCCKIAIFCTYLNVAPTKNAALTRDFTWTSQGNRVTDIPNFQSIGHHEVCQYAAKCCQNSFFLLFCSTLMNFPMTQRHEICYVDNPLTLVCPCKISRQCRIFLQELYSKQYKKSHFYSILLPTNRLSTAYVQTSRWSRDLKFGMYRTYFV